MWSSRWPMSPTFSTWLDLYGFPIKSSLLSDVVINTQRKRKQKHRRCILRNMFLLFNIPHSVCFGKFGGRRKSLQCWIKSCMRAAMERRVFAYVCFNEISLQKRKLTPHSSFTAGEVRGLCPPAFKWPLAMSQGLSDKTTRNQSPPGKKNKTKTKQCKTSLAQWWKSENCSDFYDSHTKVRESRQADSPNLSSEAVRHLIISPKRQLKKSCVTVSIFSDWMSLVLGLHCPFWPNLQWQNTSWPSQTRFTQGHNETAAPTTSFMFVWLASVQNIPICSWQEVKSGTSVWVILWL